MKSKNIIILLFASMLISCTTQSKYPTLVNPNASPEAKALLNRLYKTVDEGKIISALHHNNYNPGRYFNDLDRIYEYSGKVPLMWGGDMGWLLQQVIDTAIIEHERGRLITIMWHSQRPLDEGLTNFREQCQGEFSAEEWEQLMTEGSESYNGWLRKADEVAEYLKILKEKKIPVLWRPYHEMNGDWFWWGNRQGENGFKKLWKMMYDRYVNYHKLDNLIWVWNANGPRHTHDNAYAYDLFYPGDEYVDILATDIYNNDWKQSHHDELIVLGKGKLIALGEIGNLPTPEILKTQNKYAWFMVWTTFTEPRYNTPEVIKELFEHPNTLNWEKK